MNWIDQCNNNFVSKKLQAFSLAASQTAKETQPNRVHVGVENLSKIWPEAVNITPCYAECCCQHYQARVPTSNPTSAIDGCACGILVVVCVHVRVTKTLKRHQKGACQVWALVGIIAEGLVG